MVNPVYHKTEAGQEEIRTRARKLDHKLRALLLIVNGERSESAVLEQVSGMGLGQEALDTLLALGLIAPAGDTASLGGAAPDAPAVPAIAQDSTAASRADVAGGDGYREVYRFYTDVIGQHLGLRGYVLQVKVEKAATLVELAALRDMLGAALHKAKGEITAHVIIAELDALLAQRGVLAVVR
ncbi:hypothetical protein [Cupriavidus plantarum]|uniref:hypothetical protein n=1 Tax=Cupriavidus plantarum TaxID=942865 RepID=UPI00339DA847